MLADQAILMHIAMRVLLEANPGYSVIAAASTIAATEQLVSHARPGLLICDTDIGGESGLDLCRWVRRVSPATRVVILTSRNEPVLAKAALTAGASGYLLKDSGPDVLVASLNEAAAGRVAIDPRLGTSRQASLLINLAVGAGFSRRERDVAAELVAGLDNRSIARRLCISEETVKSHMKAIFRKLGARDRAHAVAVALGAAMPAMPVVPRPRDAAAVDLEGGQ
ncbi:MAG TPA: response regulator transcription factor [Trebonia sp.]|nr:response regulator transcription factor [Trebonia sp.]